MTFKIGRGETCALVTENPREQEWGTQVLNLNLALRNNSKGQPDFVIHLVFKDHGWNPWIGEVPRGLTEEGGH